MFLKKKQLTKGLYERGACYNSVCRAYKNSYAGFLDYNGKVIVPFKYSNAYALSEGLIAVFNGHNWGFIDKKNTIKIPFIFDNVSNFNEGLNLVGILENKKLKYGYIDKKGNFIIPPQYDNARSFSNNFAAVYLKEKWGFINKKGQQITPFKYCDIEDFKNNVAIVSTQCNFEEYDDIAIGSRIMGLINKKGEEIIPLEHDRLRIWNKKPVVEITKENKTALYNLKGEEIIPFGKYQSINRFDEKTKLIEVTKDDNKLGYVNGFVNLKGNEIIPCKYRFSSYFVNGFIYGERKYTNEEKKKKNLVYSQKKGVLNANGAIVVPFKFEEIAVLSNGFFKVKGRNSNNESYYGYYRENGQQQLPFKYNYATDFSKNGYALIKENKVYKFINTTGKIISIPKYDEIDPYIFNDLTAVKKDNKWGYINAKNEVVINFQFEEANRFHKGLAKVSNNKKHGFINTKGEVIIPIKFDKAHYYFTDEIEELILNGKKQYYNKKGEEIFEEDVIRKNGYK